VGHAGHGADDAGDHGHDDDDDHHALPPNFKPHESPWVMTLPLIILAVLSTVGGLIGVPYAMSSIVGVKDANAFEHVLDPVVADTTMETAVAAREAAESHEPAVVQKERLLAGLSVVLAAIGIAIGWFAFRSAPLRKMPKILEEKWRLDEFYNGYIVDPITSLSTKGLWKGFDLGFIDGIVNGIGHFVMEAGNLIRGIQVGFVRSYAAIILLGALAVIGYFIYYGLRLVA
jgi:NADH-quinone oxidoreductase subunit L